MRKYILLGLLVLLIVPIVYSSWRGEIIDHAYTYTNAVVTTGDGAQVVKLHAYEPQDGFIYTCSVYYATAFTGGDSVFAWTAPLQRMRLLVEGTDVDTTQTLKCSISFDATVLGFDLAIEDDARDTGVAVLVDTLVYLFNATAGLTDSVTAEDSVSYIVLVANHGEEVMGTWSAILVPAAGDTLDTASIDPTTLAMVTNSLVATVNAHAQIGSIITAEALSGDSTLTLTSDDPGLPITIVVIDTALDTSLTTANVTSWCRTYDTIALFSMSVPEKFRGLYGRVILPASTYGQQGYGGLDSGIIRLLSLDINGYEQIAVDSGAGLPETLFVNFPAQDATVLADTLYGEALFLVIEVSDSASDTTFSPPHNVKYHFMRTQ